MRCRACGRELELGSGDRVAFSETCAGCGGDLHTCVHCGHHDPGAYNACRESNAERVADPERANRCEYFRPAAAAPDAGADEARARARLDALFKR
jgi:hypothetical protein